MTYLPLSPKARSVLAELERADQARASEYNDSSRDELRESNRLTLGAPGGAHPTAGAPSSYLEDEAR